jgi:hypothetical protein
MDRRLFIRNGTFILKRAWVTGTQVHRRESGLIFAGVFYSYQVFVVMLITSVPFLVLKIYFRFLFL